MASINNMLRRLTAGAEGSGEPLPQIPIVEIAGSSRVLIENHSGVTQYSGESVCVKVKFGKIRVDGRYLTLAKMNRGQLVISGCIDGVTLFRGC